MDLLYTLTRPFISTKQRLKYYIITTILVSLTSLFSVYNSIINYCSTLLNNDDYSRITQDFYTTFYPIAALQVVYSFIHLFIHQIGLIFSAVIVNRKCNKTLQHSQKQFGQQLYSLQNEFVQDRKFYIKVFCSIWILPCIHIVFTPDLKLMDYLSVVIIIGQGIPIGLIRLKEKYFRFRFRMLLVSAFKSLSDEQKALIAKLEQDDSYEPDFQLMSQHLTKVQSSEIIKCILTAITKTLALVLPHNYFMLTNIKKFKKTSTKRQFQLDFYAPIQEGDSTSPQLLYQQQIINVTIIEYAADLFKHLRESEGISLETLITSLSLQNNENAIKKT